MVLYILFYDVISIHILIIDCHSVNNTGNLVYRVALPVWNTLRTNHFRTVVHCLHHLWIACIDILAPTQNGTRGKTVHKERHLDTEFETEVTLVDTGHGEIGK